MSRKQPSTQPRARGWFLSGSTASAPIPRLRRSGANKPLQKSWQKEKPPLGWPRTTDSLCPKCVPEIRKQILDGKLPHEVLLNEKVGEIKAQIVERDGKILMVKDCPKHGHFEDVMSIDTAFFKHLEESFPGRDMRAHNDEKLHNHGTSTVTHGRGSVLTIDLTNRCNMMCDPCFMDANQVGFVHELTWDEIKTMLDNAITIKPKRQMSVQSHATEQARGDACGGRPDRRRHASASEAARAAASRRHDRVPTAAGGRSRRLGKARATPWPETASKIEDETCQGTLQTRRRSRDDAPGPLRRRGNLPPRHPGATAQPSPGADSSASSPMGRLGNSLRRRKARHRE